MAAAVGVEEDLIGQCLERHRTPVAWDRQEGRYVTSNRHGGRLFVRSWVPTDRPNPLAVVFLSHGVNEHIGRYCDLAHALTKEGYAVVGQDHWGHGLSGGFKGDIEEFDFLVSDLKQLVLDHRKAFGSSPLPFFIIGHSMGTIVAFHASYELQHEQPGLVNGVVYSGCALVPGPSAASPFGVRCLFCLTQSEWSAATIGGLMAKLQPRGPLAPVFVEAMTHDPEELRAIAQDPLHNRGPLLNRTGNQIWKAGQRLKERLPHYALPFLALHGARDSVTYPSGSQALFDGAGSVTKELKFYPGLYHEIFLETAAERAGVLGDVAAFLADMLRDPKKNPYLSVMAGGAGVMDES